MVYYHVGKIYEGETSVSCYRHVHRRDRYDGILACGSLVVNASVAVVVESRCPKEGLR